MTLARGRTLQLPGQAIAALQSGPAGGVVALLVPGYTGSKEDFGPVLAPLGAAGFLVTAIDLPGQYESPGPPDVAAYGPDRLAAGLIGLAEQLGPPIALLGHSFGGLVARAAVIAAPELFTSLTLLSSGPAQLGGARRAAIETLQPVLASAGLPGVYAAMQAAAAAEPDFVEPPAEVAAFLERRFLSSSPAMLHGMGDALRHEPDRVAELAATGVPVLVAHGVDDDAWSPETQRAMAERLGARYAVIEAAAHSPAIENPVATATLLGDFWDAAG